MKTLYLLAGCNGAGKTTAAYALRPGCRKLANGASKPIAYLPR